MAHYRALLILETQKSIVLRLLNMPTLLCYHVWREVNLHGQILSVCREERRSALSSRNGKEHECHMGPTMKDNRPYRTPNVPRGNNSKS
jgi:hypothetical protein